MVCIVALIVFSVLGIFSGTHRALAKEAFSCVLKRITLKPCDSGFKEKIKGRIIGKLLGRSIAVARIFNKYFELISWVFVVLTIASAFFIARGAYNYYLYGSCNGLNQSGFCAFDAMGENNKVSSVSGDSCPITPASEKNLTLAGLDLAQFPQKVFASKNQIVFIGCYNCDYSRKAYPVIRQLVEKKKADFFFLHMAAKKETSYISNYAYCAYKEDKEKFWDFNDKLFASSKEDVADSDYVEKLAETVGFNRKILNQCASSGETEEVVKKQAEQIKATGIYGTPTIFINGQALVGPKPSRVYERMLK